tara:strand:- start:1239 stop:2087 length:849 start_codon:yes stop_codon:yes gene_type:complete
MRMQPKDEAKGWLTFAQNSADTNYVDLAYLLALSIKATCTHNRFAIAVDEESESNINTRQRKVFDHIIVVPHMEPFYNEALALDITPFKETFKVESDMIVPRNLDHWWNGCRIQDVCYTNNVRDYRGNIATSRKYRKFFDANYLDDAYNGFSYFRFSRTSVDFFSAMQTIIHRWDNLRNSVLNNSIYDKPDTDVLYGLAQQHLGLPCSNNLSYPTFTHMKPAINGWKESVKWQDAVPWTLTNDFDFIVGGYAQQYPFHYYDKTFCTPELTDRYEQRVRTSTN